MHLFALLTHKLKLGLWGRVGRVEEYKERRASCVNMQPECALFALLKTPKHCCHVRYNGARSTREH